MSASPAGLVLALLVLVGSAVAFVLVGPARDAIAAPYPPTESCSVWTSATDTGDGELTLTVLGTGLGPTEPVRLVHTASQRTVGFARTGTDGRFRAVVSAPAGPEGRAPQISAASPDATCTTPPGGGDNGGNGGNGGNGNGGGNGDQNGSGGSATSGAPGSSPTTSAGAGTNQPSSGASSGGSSGSTSRPTPANPSTRADPPRIIDTPFTIGLVIAAVLLVLATLLVLMIARRPDHR